MVTDTGILKEIKKKTDNTHKRLEDMEKKSEENPTKENKIKSTIISGLPFKFSIFLIAWVYLSRYSNIIDVDTFVNSLLFSIKFLVPEVYLIGGITNHYILSLITAWLGILFWINVPWVIVWIIIVNGGKITDTWKKIFKWQLIPPITLFILMLLVQGFVVNFSLNNENIGAQDIITQKVEDAKESQTLCLLKNAFSGDVNACKELQETKKAQESEKTKYEIRLLDLPITTYDYTTRNIIKFDYHILTQGGEIKINKFECYKGSVKKDNLIGESQIFDNLIVKAHNSSTSKIFTCDLSKLPNPKSDEKLKIIPVIYYTINSQIAQEIPIILIDGVQTDKHYFEAKERYKSAFKSLSAIISNKVLQVKTRWSPLPPIFANYEESNTEYFILFTFEKGNLQSSSEFGKIIDTKMTKLYVPPRFDKNCGPQNFECENKLYTEDDKSHLELNLKLNEIPTENIIEYIIIEIDTEMELKHTREIKFTNPDYIENENNDINQEEGKVQIQKYWDEKITSLNNLKTQTNDKQNKYSFVANDCNQLLTLIEQGIKVANEGKILEEKTEITQIENERNTQLKTEFNIIQEQINKLNFEIDTEISNYEREMAIANYAGP